jgi:cation:H+ antiporter
MTYLLLILGLATLIVGGEFLVKGAVGIAKKFHISTLVIGMTVISFGTSAPELIVSIKAALSGTPEIAIGNVVGSNIANIALVLGLTVIIFPIVVDRNSKVLDWPMMMLSSLLFFGAALLFSGVSGYRIERWEGMIMFAILISFIVYIITNSRKKTKLAALEVKDDNQLDTDDTTIAFGKSMLYIAIGLVGLFFGAEWLLDSAVQLATDFGMSKSVIGITIVAFGTSVPELVTSCVAAFKKETDISIGNLIGSNLFNIMAVIGITSMIKPINVEAQVVNYDMYWMLGIAAILLPMMLIGKKLGRFKGVMLFSSYVIYITLVVIASQNG